ncbi:DUF222 domain-containing protein [Nocardioides sp.]|uniref:HNH endonuclease n=1 Tax=Nocardioides sp. TaxID=35761 RepID=UPI0027224A65|nr:DUF222 domain-containing protein [Nocardioides sp.]MDO9455639.1 DUF222 domain-containing protein [Nocardioides sp.]
MQLSGQVIDDFRRLLLDAVGSADRTREADAARIDVLQALEDLKSTACALQAEVAVEVDASQRAQQSEQGLRAPRQGRGVASQIALARRESPHRGQVLLGMAKDLVAELPHTLAALREGRLNEYRAQVIVTATSGLDPEARADIDAELCADPATLRGVGTRRLEGLARRAAQKRDPAAAVRRNRRAVGDRHVSTRPAPDGMVYCTALVPLAQGVAVHAALKRTADHVIGVGDPLGRTHSQVMADVLVERVTGQAAAEDVPVQVDLILSDATLLGGGTDPALVPGHGDVPAEVARHLVAHAIDRGAAWVRRVYADPAGRLVALATNQRLTSAGLSTFLRIRDQGICRTPWCDAPIRHDDHVQPAAEGGPTTEANTQGLCEACDYAKQAPGWRQRVTDDESGRHRVDTFTPTGHHHVSVAPAPPRPARGPVSQSVGERVLSGLLAAA